MFMTTLECPKTGATCPIAELCQVVNAPLVGAVDRVRSEVPAGPGKSHAYAATAVRNALDSLGNTMVADFNTVTDGADAAICPEDILDRKAPAGARVRVSKDQVAMGLSGLVRDTIDNVVKDITASTNRKRR